MLSDADPKVMQYEGSRYFISGYQGTVRRKYSLLISLPLSSVPRCRASNVSEYMLVASTFQVLRTERSKAWIFSILQVRNYGQNA